jgi:stage V sporulation protein S
MKCQAFQISKITDGAREDQNIAHLRSFIMELIKVSSTSRTSAVAGAIAGIVREHHRAEVQAIGAGAVNQALKALILATGYLKADGIFVTFVPEFADVTIGDNIRTAIKLVIEPGAGSTFTSSGLSTHSTQVDLPQV